MGIPDTSMGGGEATCDGEGDHETEESDEGGERAHDSARAVHLGKGDEGKDGDGDGLNGDTPAGIATPGEEGDDTEVEGEEPDEAVPSCAFSHFVEDAGAQGFEASFLGGSSGAWVETLPEGFGLHDTRAGHVGFHARP